MYQIQVKQKTQTSEGRDSKLSKQKQQQRRCRILQRSVIAKTAKFKRNWRGEWDIRALSSFP
jgi:hypothetical protein